MRVVRFAREALAVLMSVVLALSFNPAAAIASQEGSAKAPNSASYAARGNSMQSLAHGTPADASREFGMQDAHASLAPEASSAGLSVVLSRAAMGKLALKAGERYRLGVKAIKGAKVSYRSSAKKVVSVSKSGVLKAGKPGKVTVTVTAKKGAKKATKKVKVRVLSAGKYKKVKSIKVKASSKKLKVGKSAKLKVSFSPKAASNKNLLFKTSNARVVAVSAKGKVTARGAGKAKVAVASAANPKVKRVVSFKVAPVAVKRISASAGRQALLVGQSAWVNASVSPLNATNKKLRFSSSNPKVIAVSAKGKVTAKKAGAAKVVVRSASNKKAKASVSFTVRKGAAVEKDVAKASYDKGAIVVKPAEAKLLSGTKARVAAEALGGEAPKNGQIVVIADGDLQGTAIKVTSAKLQADGTYLVSGTKPAFEEVFDELKLSGSDTFGMLSVSDVAEGVELAAADGSDLSEQASASGTIAPGASFQVKLTHKFFKKWFEDHKVGGDNANLKFKLDGAVSIKLTPSIDYAIDYSVFGGLARLKAMFNLNDKISGDVTVGANFKAKLLHFGAAKTGADLFFTVGLDGKVGLSCTKTSSAGIDYTRGQSGFFKKTRSVSLDGLEISAEGKLGAGVEGVLGVLDYDLAKLGIEGGGKASGSLTKRSGSMTCADVNAWIYLQAYYEIPGFIAKLGGWDAKATWDILAKSNSPWKKSAHWENGAKVAKCTWNAGSSSGGSGSSGSGSGSGGTNAGDGTGSSSTIAVPDISGVSVRSSLDAYTWAQLKSISNAIAVAGSDAAGLAIAEKYNIADSSGRLDGATKSLTLADGTAASVRVLGLRHDTLASGGKAGLSFEFADIPTTHCINTEYTNAGGWASSAMRAWLNADFYALLPSDLRSCIVAASKRTNNVGHISSENDTSCVTTTSDKLWLLSMSEVYGTLANYTSNVPWSPATYDAEGAQYKLYVDKGVTTSNYSFCQKGGADSWWWLRSPHADYSYHFRDVDSNGDWGGGGAVNAYGVSPGFCF